MKIKTLAQVKSKAHYTFDPHKVALHRPKILAKVTRCISLWSHCEAQVGQVVAFALKGDNKLAMDMYLSITSPGAASGVRRVATSVLPREYQDMFNAIMLLGKPLFVERSQLAHWLIGYSKDLKHSLLIMDPRDGLRQLSHNITSTRSKRYDAARSLSPNEIRVLSPAYLTDLEKRLRGHYVSLGLFVGALWGQEGGDWDDSITYEQFRWLYRDPQIVETIARLRGEKPSKRKSRARPRVQARRAS